MHTPKIGRSKQAKLDKVQEIKFHSDNATGSDAHPAVNVKWHGYLSAGQYESVATDRRRMDAWDIVVETFWSDAKILALNHGYSGVFTEGRSGGWLVPYTQHDSHGNKVLHWEGQGPDKGYPVFPDVTVYAQRRTFLAFQRKIKALLDTVPNTFAQEIKHIIETEGK